MTRGACCAQVDSYGSFPFVLLKVSDRSGVNKLLVRGKNLSSEQQLLQVRHPPSHPPADPATRPLCQSTVHRPPAASSAVTLRPHRTCDLQPEAPSRVGRFPQSYRERSTST